MNVLLDTNVLMRLANGTGDFFAQAEMAIDTLDRQGHVLLIVPQNVYEFWTAATKSAEANGLGIGTDEAALYVERFLSMFQFRADTPLVFQYWFELVRDNSVSGTNAYDGRLAAARLAHGISHILTFNIKDFRRYGVTIIDPASLPMAADRD